MNRRDVLRQLGWGAGALAWWPIRPLRSWAALPPAAGWTADEEALLGAVGDTLLPATPGSPGAGEVGIGRFVTTLLNDCHPIEAAEAVRAELRGLEERVRELGGSRFEGWDAVHREALLVEREAVAFSATPGNGRLHPYRLIKSLVLLGYFTSEAGATQALRYDPVPGAYHGQVPLAPGEHSWAL